MKKIRKRKIRKEKYFFNNFFDMLVREKKKICLNVNKACDHFPSFSHFFSGKIILEELSHLLENEYFFFSLSYDQITNIF